MQKLIEKTGTRWGVLAAASLAALVLYGCDTLAEGDAIALSAKEVTFRFEFNEDQFTPNQRATINARDAANLESALRSDGYEKNEVVSARIASAELRRVSSQLDLSLLNDLSIRLVSSGTSDATVASRESFPNSSTVNLDLGPTRDIDNFVRQPSFSAVAEFVPGALPDGDYVISVTLELRIEVEDL